jgi:arylsulfatase A-like enzyme
LTGKLRAATAVAVAAALAASVAAAIRFFSSPPNVIVLTVDTLRPDRLSFSGHPRETSPHIDRLARDSVLFENAVTPEPLTQPSTASMWTSRYPHQIGVVDNLFELADGYVTLAEILREASYTTAAFVSNYVLIRELSNLQQGFDLYDDRVDERLIFGAERRARHTIDRVVDWIREEPEQPFFLWVQLMDPHGPYDPPPPFDQKYRRDRPAPRPLERRQIPRYQFRGSLDPHFYIDRYDGEIAYVDHEIGRFLALLREAGLYDGALLIFHSDHGEYLGEHGIYFRHGSHIHEDSLRIPLLLKLPKKGFRLRRLPARSARLVSVMDIAPTVLDLVGLPIPEDYQGRSLLRVLRDPRKREIYVRTANEGIRGLRSEARMLMHVFDPKTGAVRRRPYYHLDRDPRQRTSVPLDPFGRELNAALEEWARRASSHLPEFPAAQHGKDTVPSTLSDRHGDRGSEGAHPHREALEALGYVE